MGFYLPYRLKSVHLKSAILAFVTCEVQNCFQDSFVNCLKNPTKASSYTADILSYELPCSLRSSSCDLPDVPNSSNRDWAFAFSGLRLSNTPPEELRPTKSISFLFKKKAEAYFCWFWKMSFILLFYYNFTTLYSYPSNLWCPFDLNVSLNWLLLQTCVHGCLCYCFLFHQPSYG